MPKVKDSDIKKLSTTKRAFFSDLKKVSMPKPESFPKPS